MHEQSTSKNSSILFFIAFASFLFYAAAELSRPGLVSSYLNLFIVLAFLFVYGLWIVLKVPHDDDSGFYLKQSILVGILAGAILYAAGFSSLESMLIPGALFLVVLLAFFVD